MPNGNDLTLTAVVLVSLLRTMLNRYFYYGTVTVICVASLLSAGCFLYDYTQNETFTRYYEGSNLERVLLTRKNISRRHIAALPVKPDRRWKFGWRFRGEGGIGSAGYSGTFTVSYQEQWYRRASEGISLFLLALGTGYFMVSMRRKKYHET